MHKFRNQDRRTAKKWAITTAKHKIQLSHYKRKNMHKTTINQQWESSNIEISSKYTLYHQSLNLRARHRF